MIDVYLGLGSNLDNPKNQILKAIKNLQTITEISVLKVSSLYQTKPVGYLHQPDFINAAVLLQTHLSPTELFKITSEIELKQGRVRAERNGPRTLDIDILLYGQMILNEEYLIVPHPRMKARSFVLSPLYELNPELKLPTGEYIRDLLQALS